MNGDNHRFLSAFQIVCSDTHPKGRLVRCERTLSPDTGVRRLADYTNTRGRFYEENHLEEWVAREPTAILPGEKVHVLATQNYIRLPEKIDLLLVDAAVRFHVVEMKINPVGVNGGESPDKIRKQMTRYVMFLGWYLDPFPTCLKNYYYKFSQRFLGSPHDLADDLRQTFGDAFPPAQSGIPVNCRVYLTEGYDEYAVNYFEERQAEGDGPTRLVYYRFYPQGHRIEFWEIPLCSNAIGERVLVGR